jgi:glycerol-3-phosphate dehydrogenase
MALTVDDVLGRRARLLFIDARAAIEAAPKVAQIMAKELGRSQEWINTQTEDFINLANNYLVK